MNQPPNKLPTISNTLPDNAEQTRAAVSEATATRERKIGEKVTVSGRPANIIKLAKDESDLPINVDGTCFFVYFDDRIGDEADNDIAQIWVKPVGNQLLPIDEKAAPHLYPDLIKKAQSNCSLPSPLFEGQ